MKITGRLRNPEFLGCSVPLTAMIRGKKVTIGRATIDYDGLVNAAVENEEVQKVLKRGLNTQVSIRLNPEVRLEPAPLHLENIIVASSDLVSE